jgi:similar to stage IV sporulation protein
MERNLEDKNSEIMWVRARIEGSTLKIKIEEKINPPDLQKGTLEGDLVASMDGEIAKIYTISGTAQVKPGDIVKKGQVLVSGIEGKEGFKFETRAEGSALANTFYEKNMEIQVEGEKLEFTGEKDEALYLNFFDKKIYIKKPIKTFKEYDKIEKKGKILSEEVYYEKALKNIDKSKEDIIESAVNELCKSTMEGVGNEAKFVKKIVSTENVGEGKVKLNVVFIIQQDISFRVTSQ